MDKESLYEMFKKKFDSQLKGSLSWKPSGDRYAESVAASSQSALTSFFKYVNSLSPFDKFKFSKSGDIYMYHYWSLLIGCYLYNSTFFFKSFKYLRHANEVLCLKLFFSMGFFSVHFSSSNLFLNYTMYSNMWTLWLGHWKYKAPVIKYTLLLKSMLSNVLTLKHYMNSWFTFKLFGYSSWMIFMVSQFMSIFYLLNMSLLKLNFFLLRSVFFLENSLYGVVSGAKFPSKKSNSVKSASGWSK